MSDCADLRECHGCGHAWWPERAVEFCPECRELSEAASVRATTR